MKPFLTISFILWALAAFSNACDSLNAIYISISNPNLSLPDCDNDTGVIYTQVTGDTTAITYQWSPAYLWQSADSLRITKAGTYYVTTTNDSGCSATANIHVAFLNGVENQVSFNVQNSLLCANHSITFTNTSSHQLGGWTSSIDVLGDGSDLIPVSGTGYAVYWYSDTGSYNNITLSTDSNGCSFISQARTLNIHQTVLCADDNLAINDLIFENSITLSPSPATESIGVEIKSPDKIVSISFWDLAGKEFNGLEEECTAPLFTHNFRVDHFPPGTYLIENASGNHTASKKFVVSH